MQIVYDMGKLLLDFSDKIGTFLLYEPFGGLADMINSVSWMWRGTVAEDVALQLIEGSKMPFGLMLLTSVVVAILVYKLIKFIVGIVTGS